jgi:hypothetical protein
MVVTNSSPETRRTQPMRQANSTFSKMPVLFRHAGGILVPADREDAVGERIGNFPKN